jgi:predicted acylesterase/phospholipase RssA
VARSTESRDLPFCDLVLKGGITSGVVYPQLIAELSDKYQFRNIGGTSAGAIAAAACAAAEYGRRNSRPNSFDELKHLPDLLGDPIANAGNESMLFHLFQPAPAVRRHFAVLTSTLNAPNRLSALGAALRAVMRQFWSAATIGSGLALLILVPLVLFAAPDNSWPRAIGSALLILLLWFAWTSHVLRRLGALAGIAPIRSMTSWWLLGLALTTLVLWQVSGVGISARLVISSVASGVVAPIAMGLALVMAGIRFASTLLSGIHANFYGICSGRTVAATGAHQVNVSANCRDVAKKGLTDWLACYINQLAGLPEDGEPLTFGHLWEGSPPGPDMPDESYEKDRTAREINLEVMTTAVSQRMCYSIPFRQQVEENFYYDEEEWGRLFPPNVVAALRGSKETEGRVLNAQGRSLRPLPPNRSLPVVVAVRMSLSFPVLLSAVPLYAIDWSRTSNQELRAAWRAGLTGAGPLVATRVWFSDGGISSNMPLHFFDAALPGHPTFAVNLKAPHPDFPVQKGVPAEKQKGRVFLPQSNLGGLLRYWPEPNDATPMGGIVAFLGGIINTMQSWRDEILFPYPGYRDRIVQISQLPDEGGLNLNMPKANIDALSEAGAFAAHMLIARFHPAAEPPSKGWQNHQDVRLRSFLGVLERLSGSLHSALAGPTWGEVVQMADYTQEQKALAIDCLARLQALGDALKEKNSPLEGKAPSPRPSMRIAPQI